MEGPNRNTRDINYFDAHKARYFIQLQKIYPATEYTHRLMF